jgi:hypothetical protein
MHAIAASKQLVTWFRYTPIFHFNEVVNYSKSPFFLFNFYNNEVANTSKSSLFFI